MSERLPPAEIEAMKLRVEESLDDLEAAHRAYETWMINWRIRQSDRARAIAELEA